MRKYCIPLAFTLASVALIVMGRLVADSAGSPVLGWAAALIILGVLFLFIFAPLLWVAKLWAAKASEGSQKVQKMR